MKTVVEYYMRRKGRYYFRNKNMKFSFIIEDKDIVNKLTLNYGDKKLIEISTK